MKDFTNLLLVALLALSGCAAKAPLPHGFDASRVTWAEPSAPTIVSLEGPSGKSNAARKGALAGGGAGLLYSGLLCAAIGPFAPLCFGTVVPAVTIVGAGGGAVAGAVTAESAAHLTQKRDYLNTQVAGPSSPQSRLVSNLKKLQPDSPRQPTSEWIAIVELTGLGAESDHRLFAEGTLSLRHADASANAFTKSYQISERVELLSREANHSPTAAQLTEDDNTLSTALDTMLGSMAGEVLADLRQER